VFENQVAGVVRFRDKVYQLVTTRTAIGGEIKDNETLKLMHKTIKKVTTHHTTPHAPWLNTRSRTAP
jgi:hypothetical protein